jgi:RNA polymerase sigma-70 factor (ECF subfamily)
MVGDFSQAEEIVQDLFVQLWKRGTLDNVSNPEPYLLRCVRFKSIDYLRYKDTKMEIQLEAWHGATNASLDELPEEEIEPLLHYFADKLPPKTKQVFLLSRESNLTYKEIADQLHISIKTVEAQMTRALRKMRSILKEQRFL